MGTKRGRDAADQAPKPDADPQPGPHGVEGTATGSPRREDGTRAIEVEDLNSADDEGAN